MTAPLVETRPMASVYQPMMMQIQEMRWLTRLEALFRIGLPGDGSLSHKPGQFMEVSILGVGEAPISISSSPSRSNGAFELCVRKVGRLTSAMHALCPGDSIGVRGPFGRGFPVERLQGKDLLFAPGGLGLAPLRSLINQVLDDRRSYGRVIVLYGARNPSELLFADELAAWQERDDVEVHITVDHPDQAWRGNVGVITTLFPKVRIHPRDTVAVTVGPPVMYRFVLAELIGMGLSEDDIWLSLERRMKCGVGKCGHCQINHIYTCQDGPSFSYAQIKSIEEAL